MPEKQFGSVHAFRGNLSPVSISSIVQHCVLPVLLYGVEMSTESLKKLECFQGEIAKRILKLPKWFSNTAACDGILYTLSAPSGSCGSSLE